ncbi:UPF0659 protein [Lachnellula hyalina]|uniref:UPF0659 protein n=1 Tax=Lachnellula hyalina TaxID=1316788 RepID=A0A8H8TXQ7_9HELO|nr:UPF0659 protein [Lachnellula hyalina]TVY26304.1 UPF0659 protein [Lachnellula hyalina]
MTPRILLLGGHGKISLLMTPKLLARSWNLTSVIRDPAQKAAIQEAGKAGPGKLDVLVESLDEVKSESDAKRILDLVKPDWVIWSAGAGGKGGASRTNAIDKEACIHFIRSALSTPTISKFLLVTALSERRQRAPWWDDESWALVQKMNTEILPAYYAAKLASDDVLTVLGRAKQGFGYILLRPGSLSDEQETGKVELGKTRAKGTVARADVAEVAVRLLERGGGEGWFDSLGGEEEVGKAVERVVREGVDCMEGEDVEVMKAGM